MKKVYVLVIATILSFGCISIKADIDTDSHSSSSYENDKANILKVLEVQETAWNNGDLEAFMDGYWKSDELKFYGANGLTKGWQNTLDNYKRNYPTKADTGTLNFVLNDISKIEGNNYWVMGEYHLKREVGDADGVFIIIFKKIDGEWKIIADMSC
ncbi:YybH family protein [Winogradskyella immobilis]|uniref:Nuclear transport factor 2 family protein n=1 Tax=Winogradskyella immobilis TaxID=2816852 RepID=A0ABS8EIQ8_9FLAO|nr:nuclear transport factor 2 family protein [Winogradskyella immobilis]MCC1483093.1 nuclear transport factor 2 family protein [Winogradskyella immobilis]MCG0015188.1 nuclear transport factor 2 family protein [Winogradskyella immobilis]